MTAPSNANTSGLDVVAWRYTLINERGDVLFSGSVIDAPPREGPCGVDLWRVDPLVTAASAQAAIDAEKARADRLAKALDALQDLFAHEGECSMERFERIAEMFRKDTGYLAPGKDPGMLSQQPEGDELRRIYDDWYAGKIKAARAALQQETQP